MPLLFIDDLGRPMHDQHWSKLWQKWREAARWPAEGTFHSLRHFYATALIPAGADPTASSGRFAIRAFGSRWRRTRIGAQEAASAQRRQRDRGSAEGAVGVPKVVTLYRICTR